MEPESRTGSLNYCASDKVDYHLEPILRWRRGGEGGRGGAVRSVVLTSRRTAELDLKKTYNAEKISVALYDGNTVNTMVLTSTNTNNISGAACSPTQLSAKPHIRRLIAFSRHPCA